MRTNFIIKNNALSFDKDHIVLFSLFSLLFLLQFIFREFLFYLTPFMPSTGINMTYLELIGTFSIFGLGVVIPFLLHMLKIPLRFVYLVVTTIMLWGGTILSLVYPTYYMTLPWILGSIALTALTILSLITVIYELRATSIPMIPLILLQILSLTLYLANVMTEYFALPLGGLSPYFTYPMLYLAGIGGVALLVYSIYVIIADRKINVKVLIGYAVAAVIGFFMAYPLYELTLYNSFMAHMMSMVFAMGLGILASPSSMPLVAIFMGIYTYSIIALIINGAFTGSPIRYVMAVASLVYLVTAFVEHALVIMFAPIIVVSNALIYINLSNKAVRYG